MVGISSRYVDLLPQLRYLMSDPCSVHKSYAHVECKCLHSLFPSPSISQMQKGEKANRQLFNQSALVHHRHQIAFTIINLRLILQKYDPQKIPVTECLALSQARRAGPHMRSAPRDR